MAYQQSAAAGHEWRESFAWESQQAPLWASFCPLASGRSAVGYVTSRSTCQRDSAARSLWTRPVERPLADATEPLEEDIAASPTPAFGNFASPRASLLLNTLASDCPALAVRRAPGQLTGPNIHNDPNALTLGFAPLRAYRGRTCCC
jgi:hypothetical protein